MHGSQAEESLVLKSGMTAMRRLFPLLDSYQDECGPTPLELTAPSNPGLGTTHPGLTIARRVCEASSWRC